MFQHIWCDQWQASRSESSCWLQMQMEWENLPNLFRFIFLEPQQAFTSSLFMGLFSSFSNNETQQARYFSLILEASVCLSSSCPSSCSSAQRVSRIEQMVLLKAVRLPPIQSSFSNASQYFLLVQARLMAVKASQQWAMSWCPRWLCLPLGMILRQRYQMLRLKMRRLLLLGCLAGSLDTNSLWKPTSQSICSFYSENSQHSLIFSRCSLMGMQETRVQMLYFEVYSCEDSSLSCDSITASHFISTFSKVSSLLSPSYSLRQTALSQFQKSKKYFLILTTATSSFILKMFFSILGMSSVMSWRLMVLRRGRRWEWAKRVRSWWISLSQVVRMDSQSQGMLVAQLRLFIIGFRLIFMLWMRLPTMACTNTSLLFPRINTILYLFKASYTILGVRYLLTSCCTASSKIFSSSSSISRTTTNQVVSSAKSADCWMVLLSFYNLPRQSSSLMRATLSVCPRAGLSSTSNSFLSSSIFISSHSRLSIFSRCRSTASCSLCLASQCDITLSLD